MKITQNENTLHAGIDLTGREIMAGSIVRSYDFAFSMKGTTPPLGFDETGERAAWVEGVVEAVGEDVMEGCPRYRISARLKRRGDDVEIIEPVLIYPPVNGTKNIVGGVTCGVVAVDLPDDWDSYGFRTNIHRLQMPESCIDSFFGINEDAIEVSEDRDGWWLQQDGQQGAERYTSLEAAQSDAQWEARQVLVTQKEDLLQEAGLPHNWDVIFTNGLSFVCPDNYIEIQGDTDIPTQKWHLFIGDDDSSSTYTRIEDAVKDALEAFAKEAA